ncbi:MAG: tRNA (N6-isopentenyl adenosine(37)-C2)-methylthiotransferase MiaB [Bdellovibrionota bacterium]|nr:MAG: tRNA (N6-isopentenyl adenosine(37)-C2)-methylthiotransferase MiaB [Bdellovibrionota bacterium]
MTDKLKIIDECCVDSDPANDPAIGQKGKLFIKTYGCQMNEYDSTKLAALLEHTHELTTDPQHADLILVNTCSVRDKPEQKLYSLLGRLRELKERKPQLMIGVGGCVAQQEGEQILKRNAGVDFVFGTHNLSLVPSLVSLRTRGAPPQVAVDYRDDWEDLPPGFGTPNRVSVFVSISRGCNKNCTYCIVPTTRGSEVSRGLEEILREIRLAVHRGAKEVTLLGQTVNSWGLDFTPRRRFSELIYAVAEVQGLERIRFTSPHPQEVRKDFIDCLASTAKLCRHLHMPLQSGSDRILQAMNRNYRMRRYYEIIDAVRQRVPEVAITTDLIVGFPGETPEDFNATLDAIERVQFDNSFSFMFSPRPGTAAAAMKDDVPSEEKLRRLQVLQDLQFEITTTKLGGWIGRSVEVLLEGPSADEAGLLAGRTTQNWMVNLMEAAPSGVKAGDLVSVQIKDRSRFTLRGSLQGTAKGEAVDFSAATA